MKLVQINATCGSGSTGKICVSVSMLLSEKDIDNYILYCSGDSDYPLGIKCSNSLYLKMQALKSRLCGNWGFNSNRSTQRMIRELNRINPDIVHLHNIHGHDCNLEILFKYFKSKKIKLFWTFHDCWAFTGYCMHFTMIGCNKWKTQCANCPQSNEYSWIFDKSNVLYEKKKELFSNLDLTIITPSQWLASIVERSYLKEYPVKVINNGIDLNVFKPTESNFRDKYNLGNKHIVLGVAFDWSVKKGLDVFVELSEKLDSNYQVVLVGTDDEVDKKLSSKIISIHRTQNQQELAEIYSVADVFVNPTREENYPTVNMEAIACGTPVITFNTGGSPEMLDDSCGVVIECDNVDALEKEIIRVCELKPYSKENCFAKSLEFDRNERYKEYLQLYERVNFK